MKVQLDIQGTTGLLVHNVRLADPLDSAAKRLSGLTGAKSASKRTTEDHMAIARAEFDGGLYFDDEIGPYVPTLWLEAALKKAGGLTKEGTQVQRALIFFEGEAALQYDGPRDLAGLWADENYRLTTMVKQGQVRVPRTRPMFRQWSLSTTAHLDTSALELKDLNRIGRTCGLYIGLGDWRPRYGRFEFNAHQIEE